MNSISIFAGTLPRAADTPSLLTRLTEWVARRIDACRGGPSDAEIIAMMDPHLLADIGIDPASVAPRPVIHTTALMTGWSR